jgi:hypothetical protein
MEEKYIKSKGFGIEWLERLGVATLTAVVALSCDSAVVDPVGEAQMPVIEGPVIPAQPYPPAPPGILPVPEVPDPQIYVGPAELEKYVQKFIDDAKAQGVNLFAEFSSPVLELRFASLDSYGTSVIGLCETAGGKRRVTFDPDFWERVSETQRELLAHHELGHCVLYRGHRSATLSSGAVASIMYPTIMGSSTYLSDYDYYQEELFTYGQALLGDVAEQVTYICDTHDLEQ